MKKYLISIVTVLSLLSFAAPASAALLGSVDITAALSDLNASPSYTLSDLKRDSVTTLPATAPGSVSQIYDSSLAYFTDTVGIRRQNIRREQTVPITERAGTNFTQVHGGGDFLLVNNGTSKRSFLYDVKRHKSVSFQPRIGLVTSGQFVLRGKVLVMIAKNIKGESKLFISQGDPKTIKEFALPKIASSCSAVAVSPKGTMLSLICETTTAGTVVFTAPINGQTLGQYNKRVDTSFLVSAMTWLSERRLVVSGNTSTSTLDDLTDIQFRQWVVNSKAKVVTSQTLTLNVNGYNPQPSSVLDAAYQLERISDHEFFFNVLQLGGVGDENNPTLIFQTVVGYFEMISKTQRTLVNNNMFNILFDLPNSNP